MTRVHRNVAKFTKIYKNKDGAFKIDNFGDEQMQKWVDQFKADRRKYKRKKKVGLNNNINNNNDNKLIQLKEM